MKDRKFNPLVFIFSALPYSFLAMYGDFKYGSMILYGFAIIAVALLIFVSKKKNAFLSLFFGSTVSLAISVFLTANYNQDHWNWYFKPLSEIQMSLLLSIIILIVEGIA